MSDSCYNAQLLFLFLHQKSQNVLHFFRCPHFIFQSFAFRSTNMIAKTNLYPGTNNYSTCFICLVPIPNSMLKSHFVLGRADKDNCRGR
ncbi:unnamed protein product [Amoebophrya sp. A120]|nr:unnamed protein product [Amoebophrya sp. A120]|eukprot:GSA120T00009101001.1